MGFEDIGTDELRQLGLYPIHNFFTVKAIVSCGYFEKYTFINQYTGKNVIVIYPIARSKNVWKEPRDMENVIGVEKTEIDSFDSITPEQFALMGLKGRSFLKITWLQKYLRGEVTGTYNPPDTTQTICLISQTELDDARQEINELKEKNLTLRMENKRLREDNKHLNKEIKETKKKEQKIKKIKEFFECI